MLGDAYRPRTSALHRLDPRVKLPLLALVVVCFFVRSESLAPPLYVALLFALAALCLGPGDAISSVRLLLPLLVFIVVLTPLFAGGGAWRLTPEVLGEVHTLYCRLVGVSLAFFLFFRTTATEAFIATLGWYGLPFRASLVMGLALRWIPSMMRIYEIVVEAHSLRRATGSSGRTGPVDRIRQLIPVITSVLIHSIRQIPGLAMALESRGVGRPNDRTRAYRFQPLSRIVPSLLGGLAAAAAVVLPLVLARG